MNAIRGDRQRGNDMDLRSNATSNRGAHVGDTYRSMVERASMTPAQRDNARMIAQAIAVKMPTGMVRNMLERAARDTSADAVIKKIDEHTLLIIHHTLEAWEAGRAHDAAIR